MAKLADYGIRIINHGEWSDPEVQWKKSRFQTLLFNYWDVMECFENEDYDLSKEADIATLEDWLWNLTPSEYDCPDIYYEWIVWWDCYEYSYNDNDYFKDNKLSVKEDYVLHNSSQALKQAMKYIDEEEMRECVIEIFRHDFTGRHCVSTFSLRGSTLRDITDYSK